MEQPRSHAAPTAHELARCHHELTALWTEQTREHLELSWTGDEQARAALHGRPVAEVIRTADSPPPRAAGWCLWGHDQDGRPDDRRGAWSQLVEIDVIAEREHVGHAAIESLAKRIGSDQAKGVDPFGVGGISGPGGYDQGSEGAPCSRSNHGVLRRLGLD